jgi:transcriptional regulator with XRE-family HTH domain
MDIGNKLKSLRIQKKLEAVNMADLLKISETTYRRYERNESAPDFNMLEKLLEYMKCQLQIC